MNTAKIRIKMGPIEIDYDGTEDFLKQELSSILMAVSTLYRDAGSAFQTQGVAAHTDNVVQQGPLVAVSNPGMSVKTVAAKLGIKSGPELILAAALRLSRSGVANISRAKLLEEMKQATGYFKTNHTSNLSKSLLTLVKDGKLQETAKDTYALSNATLTELEARLAS